MINTNRNKQILENRERLNPIVESIIFLGKQNISFRGNFDYGKLINDTLNIYSITNQGNFRELLKYKILSGDNVLEEHLKSVNSKATYISPMIQNDLIKCFKNYITEKIINEVKDNKYFSIIFDETTDISHTSQMSLILRYFFKGIVKESFVAFIDCHDDAFSQDESNDNDNHDDSNDNIDINN